MGKELEDDWKMTKELQASCRDAENKKYKLYKEHEDDIDVWSIVHNRVILFKGTPEELAVYCKDAGLEFGVDKARSVTAVEGEEGESIPLEKQATDQMTAKVIEAEPLTDGQNETMTPEEKLDFKIAELKAKKKEMEK